MRKKKVLSIEFFPSRGFLEKMERMGHEKQRRQVRLLCLCTGITDANRICEKYGLGDRVFDTKYACETGNMKEIEVMNHTELAVMIHGSTRNYIPIQQLLDNKEMEE